MDGRSRCVPSSTDAVSSMKLKHEKMNLNLKESVCQNRYPASSNQKFVVQMKSSSLFVLRSSKVLERLLSGAVRSPRDRCSLSTRWHWRCSGCNGGSERRNPICCRRKTSVWLSLKLHSWVFTDSSTAWGCDAGREKFSSAVHRCGCSLSHRFCC